MTNPPAVAESKPGELATETAPPAKAGPVPGARSARPGRGRDRWAALVFLTPATLLFLLLVLAPIAISAYTSLFKWNGFVTSPMQFLGLRNFTRMFNDDVFVGDLWRGIIIIVLSLVVQLPAALGLAMLLNQPLRGRSFYRLLFFAPYVLSEVTTGVLFLIVFSPSRGLAREIFGWFGQGDLAANWLSDTGIVLYSVFFVISWKYFGLHMILYLAGRQNIPKELIEAATVDGASPWQVFRRITLPLLGPTIRISIFLSVIGAIQLFDMVWVLTGGGPAHASETMAVTMFQYGFRRFEVGYATAISIVMFLICLIFALLYQRYVLRRDIEGAVTVMGGKR